MLKNSAFFCLMFAFTSCNNQPNGKDSQDLSMDYPETRKDTTVSNDYHGIKINDPYRWLEDDNSSETIDWVTEQNKVTQGFLNKIPFKEAIKERLTDIWDYERVSTPFKKGNHYYIFKNDGLQNQSVLYRIDEKEDIVVLNPNDFSKDGTSSLGSYSFSEDAKLLAYQVSEGGSDWRQIRVLDLTKGEMLSDKVDWVKFSGMAWSKDGFFYSRYPAVDEDGELSQKNEFHKVYYHKIGTDQEADKLVFEDKDNPQQNAYASTSKNGEHLVISPVKSTSGNAIVIKNIKKDGPIQKVVDGFDNDFSFIDELNGALLFMTNKNAPNQKIIAIDPDNTDENNWTDVIPESKDALRWVNICGNHIIAGYLENASSKVKSFTLDGKYERDIELPGIGTVGGVQGLRESEEAFYSYSSFTVPTRVYKIDLSTGKSALYKAPEVNFDTDQYVTRQEWFKSKDGTKVPVFITHKKGLKMDGKRPTLLYGYGGFDIPIVPGFKVGRMILLENDGILAIANIRGGGEFGSAWHKAGTLGQKQNVFDDFQGAAEYLIESGYTSSEKLAIEGRSNGGLLVGACMTQRPDLYKVAFPGVGVLDMLRYHEFTIGWAWAADYGRSDDPEAFEYLIKYSPLHNVKKVEYPATMITTADHDDRVVPAHSFKFAAELQEHHQGNNPVLIRVETSAGHGAGKPTSMQIEEVADVWSFMFYNMNEDIKYLKQ